MRIKPHVKINEEVVDVTKLANYSVSLEQYQATRANTPGWHALYPKLNHEALAHAVRHNLANCERFPDSTYDSTLVNILAPELLRRLERLAKWEKAYEQLSELFMNNFHLDVSYITIADYFRVLQDVGLIGLKE